MPDNRTMAPCPHCGEMIRNASKACPYCGSDEKTGWSQKTYLDGIDLDDDIDYEEMVKNEFPQSSPASRKRISWKVIVGSIVLFFFVAAMLKMVFGI